MRTREKGADDLMALNIGDEVQGNDELKCAMSRNFLTVSPLPDLRCYSVFHA